MSTAEVVAKSVKSDEIKLDLVFVHGLSDDWQSTWNKAGISWIEKFLPKDIPSTRILTCGWGTQDVSQKDPSLGIRGLQDYEKKRDNKMRPVVFLAHSLGGLILQNFLQHCDPALRLSTKGIMFFGTPNSFQNIYHRTRFVHAMALVGYNFDDEYLSFLASTSEGFSAWLNETPFTGRVVCFYETLPITDDVVVLDKISATLPHCEAEGLDASHLDMTKFSSTTDTNYQIVLQYLKSMYFLADDSMRVLLRHSLEAHPHSRLGSLPTTPDGCEEIIVSTHGTPAERNLVRLALVAEDQGHYKKAEEKYKEVIDSLSRSGQCTSAVRELTGLALAHAERHLDLDTETKFVGISDLLRKTKLPGLDDAAILFCIHKWACLMYGRGRYTHAELYSRHCLEFRIKFYGKGSMSTLLTAANWISCMVSLGRHKRAHSTIRDALEFQDLTLPHNVSAIQVLQTFAKLATVCGYHDLAESLLCDVLRKAIYLYGWEHPFTLNHVSELAAILERKGNLSSAEALSRYSLAGLEQMLGNDHPHCLRAACRLADYVCLQRRYDDAILRHKEVLTKQRLRIGNQHPETLLTMKSLGIDFALHLYWKDAETVLEQAVNGLETCLGSDDNNTVWAVKALNAVKELQGERAPEEGAMQMLKTCLLQPTPTTHRKNPTFIYGPSPFQTQVESDMLRAVIDDDLARLKDLLQNQANNSQILGQALREAAASSHKSAVQLLLQFDAPVNAQSGYHGSALQAASLAGSLGIVELLLQHNADVNLEGGIFGNALRAAVYGGYEPILCLLLGSHSSGGLSRNILNTSIQLALRTENLTIIDRLVKAGADIDAEDNLFGSPLQQASFYGQSNIMMTLLERKSNINMGGGLLASPLQAAIETQNEWAVNRLLQSGAKIRSISADIILDGHILQIDEREELARILLKHLAESLPYRSISATSGSYNPSQNINPAFTKMTGRTGLETPSGTNRDSQISFPVPKASGKPRPIQDQSMLKGLDRKPRRTFPRFWRRKLSMHV
ncbi:MAG: hypothetical protein LQ337_005274 [Flavoplaca oasis]|nr:MAG: hypothetical protein LQ337_005274 [Flavoplaca oasis]